MLAVSSRVPPASSVGAQGKPARAAAEDLITVEGLKRPKNKRAETSEIRFLRGGKVAGWHLAARHHYRGARSNSGRLLISLSSPG